MLLFFSLVWQFTATCKLMWLSLTVVFNKCKADNCSFFHWFFERCNYFIKNLKVKLDKHNYYEASSIKDLEFLLKKKELLKLATLFFYFYLNFKWNYILTKLIGSDVSKKIWMSSKFTFRSIIVGKTSKVFILISLKSEKHVHGIFYHNVVK